MPRAGRIHTTDFAIVGLSEIEGTARFADAGTGKGVSGVRLQLRNARDETIASARTEIDGYYFFEQVPPGDYRLVIDPEQQQRLRICMAAGTSIMVGANSGTISRDLGISACP